MLDDISTSSIYDLFLQSVCSAQNKSSLYTSVVRSYNCDNVRV